MLCTEYKAVLGTYWSPRFINGMVDTLSKRVVSDIYITSAVENDPRKVAMKSVVGVLSGNFKPGDTVKILIYGREQEKIDDDLKVIIDVLNADQ